MRPVRTGTALAGAICLAGLVTAPRVVAQPVELPREERLAAKPQWQRFLQGRAAQKAQQYQQQLEQLQEAGKLEAALKVAQALAALRAKAQGADHWQVADTRWDVIALRRALRQDEQGRADFARGPALVRQGLGLLQQRRYQEAQPLLERALAIARKVLGEEHPGTANCYNNVALNLKEQGKYAEATPLYQKALAISRKTLGDEHPDTATLCNNLALCLDYQHKYAEAGRLFQEALTVRLKVMGEQYLGTANSYKNLAYNLRAQGKHAQAIPLCKKALDIRVKVLGEEDPLTLTSYDDLANALMAQGRFTQATPFYRKALTIRRKTLGEEHPATAASYNFLGTSLHAEGRYAEAAPVFQKALAIRRKVLGEDHLDTAQSYNNLAAYLDDQGKHAEAASLYQKALAIHRKVLGEDDPGTAGIYHNLAANLHAQGKYAEAASLYQKALAIYRKRLGDEHPILARSYSNLALALNAQGKYAQAAALLRKALAICRTEFGEEHFLTALSYNNLAGNLNNQAKYAEAALLFRKALAIYRKVLGEEHPDTARSYQTLASNLYCQGKYAEATPLYQKALAIRRKVLGEDHPFTAATYSNLAYNLNAQGQYAEAEDLWQRAAAIFAKARLHIAASGLERAAITGKRSPLPSLAAVLARNGKPEEAWQRFEESLARGTWDDLSARLRRTPAELDHQAELVARLKRLDKLLAPTFAAKKAAPDMLRRRKELLGQQRQAQEELAAFGQELEKKYGPAAGQVFDRKTIQASLSPDTALVGWLDIPGQPRAKDPNGEHWAVLLRSAGETVFVRLRGSGPEGDWTEADTWLPAHLRAALQSPAGPWQPLARRLRQQRLDPLAKYLAAHEGLPAVRRLIALQSAWLTGVPVEVFADRYTVSYAPSGTLFAHLRQQPKLTSDGLLALADPAPRAGDGAGPRLPGTRREAQALQRLFAGQPCQVLTGSAASEQRLDELAKSGELGHFRYIHLATHGQMDDRFLLRSAVILAGDKLPDPLKQLEAGLPVYDGRLTARKVLEKWHLHSELVTLSACQTALGKYEGGEGFVGFSQALLLAGSRSVCISMWKVDDTATALLMTRFYENLLGTKRAGDISSGRVSKAEALAEAQRWLRSLSRPKAEQLAAALAGGELRGTVGHLRPVVGKRAPVGQMGERPFAHPYYWAAFILIGDPE
jgi:tetratricopeptide (TPR) repeat protein/CHAT domain-containing protein